MNPTLNHQKKLIGFGSKEILKGGFEQAHSNGDVCDYVLEFQSIHGLNGKNIDPVIPLLKMGGMSSRRISTETMAALIEIMKRQIATLEQEQLDAILDKCYSYLTVLELAPIGIAVLERLRFVDPDIWAQIVSNGLDEPPYTDLPLSIKRRIWASQPEAFDHEIAQIVEKSTEVPLQTTLEEFVNTTERQRFKKKVVKELLRLVYGAEDDLVPTIVVRIVEIAAKEKVTAKRTGIANLLHDFMIMLTSRHCNFNENLTDMRKMAIFLDGTAETTIDQDDHLKRIRLAIGGGPSLGPVSLLVASTYSRDFLADQLVGVLQSRRGPVGTGDDPTIIADATEHLRADPWIEDLTFLCLCNIRAAIVVGQGQTPSEADTFAPFELFYPLLIGEMDSDTVKMEDAFFQTNAVLPNDKLIGMVQRGVLERRVITSYCLSLCVHGNIVGLSRFRMVLDNVYRSADSVEETREYALSYLLVTRGLDDMYSMPQ